MDTPGDQSQRQREYDRLQTLLRRARQEAGLRQQDVAARLGVPQSYISKIELGERRIDVVELRRLCLALGMTLTDFVRQLDEVLEDLTANE